MQCKKVQSIINNIPNNAQQVGSLNEKIVKRLKETAFYARIKRDELNNNENGGNTSGNGNTKTLDKTPGATV